MPISLKTASKSVPMARVLERVLKAPRKRLLQALTWVGHYPSFHGLNREIHACGMTALAAIFPEYRFKFLGPYLSPIFPVAQRAASLRHSYRFLASQNVLPFRTVMAGGMVELWSQMANGERFDAVLGPMQESFLEGDLALIFRCDGIPLYRLSFSFLPGSFVGLKEETALFIGGSQGYRGTALEFRRVAKIFGEICPTTLLLILLKAISKALGVQSLLGVSMAHHSCPSITSGKVRPVMAYDGFWEANGAERLGSFFLMNSEMVFRPSEARTSSHRARARRKQEKKIRLYAEMLAKLGFRPAQESVAPSSDWKAAALVPA